ncbi:MAG: T9SS type A sorting domain-containing protein [Flavobacteriales bacterium]|nr:T9SS type A sorting domain-containing protein [Flavobacteriales bacterium]
MKAGRTYVPLFLICFSTLPVFGQFKTVEIEGPGISFSMRSDGRLCMDDDSLASSHFQGMPNAHFLKYLQLWAVGYSNSVPYISASLPNKAEFWPGPIDTVRGKALDPYDWDEVWTISRPEVEQHIRRYADPDYEIPSGIANWPARHAERNIASYIAAFADWNGNGVYDPEAGDYPFFLGDRVAYSVSNDEYGEHLHSGSGKLQMEHYQSLFTYNQPGFEGIIFGKSVLVNRSNQTYAPLYMGHYVDAQLGNRNDNRFRTLVDEDLIWFYNGDGDDDGPEGFGRSAPVAALLYLDKDITASTCFVPGDAVRGIPTDAEEITHCMQGKWRNGTPKYMSGNGTSGSIPTNFSFPGDTDPANTGSAWFDEANSQGAGERIALVNTTVAKLDPGAYVTLHFALLLDTGMRSEAEIRQRAQLAQNRFRTIAASETVQKFEAVGLFGPNPLASGSDMQVSHQVRALQLFDLSGRLLLDYPFGESAQGNFHIIPSTQLPRTGTYIVKLQTQSETRTARLIIH